MTSDQISDVKRAIDIHDYLKKSYFWTPASNASGRRYDERKYTLKVEVVDGDDTYVYSSHVRCSTKNFYYTGVFSKNGKQGDVRLFKRLLV